MLSCQAERKRLLSKPLGGLNKAFTVFKAAPFRRSSAVRLVYVYNVMFLCFQHTFAPTGLLFLMLPTLTLLETRGVVHQVCLLSNLVPRARLLIQNRGEPLG